MTAEPQANRHAPEIIFDRVHDPPKRPRSTAKRGWRERVTGGAGFVPSNPSRKGRGLDGAPAVCAGWRSRKANAGPSTHPSLRSGLAQDDNRKKTGGAPFALTRAQSSRSCAGFGSFHLQNERTLRNERAFRSRRPDFRRLLRASRPRELRPKVFHRRRQNS